MWIKECTSSNRNKDGKWTKVLLKKINTPAWRKLPPKSQSLYILVKLEWKGEKRNNNGKSALSCRQAAKKCGYKITAGLSINYSADIFYICKYQCRDIWC